MQSIALITALLPIACSIQAGGTFNRPMIALATDWEKRAREFAKADRINNEPLFTALAGIKDATEFETQQQALHVLIDTMNRLLDDIPAGRLPEYVAPQPTASEMLASLGQDIEASIDRFTIANDVETRLRRTSSELHGNIISAVIAGERDNSAMVDVEIVTDAVNYIGDSDYRTRNAKMIAAAESVKRLAA